jgi:hypothetical protein
MVLHHQPGDKLFLDYAGDKAHYFDRDTGEMIECEVFVGTLGYSNLTAVVACHTQNNLDTVMAVVAVLEQIGGVPKAVVPDNLKAAVTKSDRYEPQVNDLFLEMANHYGMAVLPTRAYKPKDKAKVERSVRLVYERIMAPLRHRIMHSLNELNEALMEQAGQLNNRLMKQHDLSRSELFDRDERSLLRPLPTEPFEPSEQLQLTVQQNYHVYHSRRKQYYSVPFRLAGQRVNAVFNHTLVRIYHQGECVATHDGRSQLRYNTMPDHMPSHHKVALEGMNETSLRRRAQELGPSIYEVIDQVLAKSRHPEQAYKSCQGILALAKKTTLETLQECCAIALEYNVCTYTNIQRLVLGRYANRKMLEQGAQTTIPLHENVRGAEIYR